jgi:hypothetical protein
MKKDFAGLIGVQKEIQSKLNEYLFFPAALLIRCCHFRRGSVNPV